MENDISFILDPRRWLSAIPLLRGDCLSNALSILVIYLSVASASESEEWGTLVSQEVLFPLAWLGEHDCPTRRTL